MKTVSILIITILCLCLPTYVSAQVPGIINYQGRVSVGGTNFNGTGYFKFALVDSTGATRYWSNGVNTVSLTVTKGLYSVLLGDTSIANMSTAIPASVFANTDVRLRIWFNDAVSGFQQLAPDQRIASVGYALTVANFYSLGNNTFAGQNAGNLAMSGSANTANGAFALQNNTSGAFNTANGVAALQYNTTGLGNTANGFNALLSNTTGNANIALGNNAGYNVTTGNNNIDIGNVGVPGESGVIRIGTAGTQTATYLAGSVGIGTTTTPRAPLEVAGAIAGPFGPFLVVPGYTQSNLLTVGWDGVNSDHVDLRSPGNGNGPGLIRLCSSGNVGIDTSNPDAALSVNGTVDKPGGGSWGTFSDIRLKKNVEPLAGALNRLLELRAVTFEYKDPQAIHELPGVQIGMIAQEVEKVFPDWVDTAPNGMKRLNIHGFEALTVEALREVRSENQRQIQERDARIAELERRLVQMEKQTQAVSHEVRELQAAPQSAANVRSNGGM